MKRSLPFILLNLGLSIPALAAPVGGTNYKIAASCDKGQVASAAAQVVAQADGGFLVNVLCVPADCLVKALPEKRYVVTLVPSRDYLYLPESGSRIAAINSITEFTAQTGVELRAESQKLMDQGVCNFVKINSPWDLR